MLQITPLAGILGERHRIIANDWQAANLSQLISRLLGRALEILEQMDFSPQAVRSDISRQRAFPEYLYSASELIDRAAVEEGRVIYDNIRKFVNYIFAHAAPEVVPFLIYALASTGP